MPAEIAMIEKWIEGIDNSRFNGTALKNLSKPFDCK